MCAREREDEIKIIGMYLEVVLILCLSKAVASSECQRQCGSVAVPYPFGIGDGCFREPAFNFTCNNTFKPPKLLWGNFEVINVSVEQAEMTIKGYISYECDNSSISLNRSDDYYGYLNLNEDWPFCFSQRNRFTIIGCNFMSFLKGKWGHQTSSACATFCTNDDSQLVEGTCDGVGCCQVPVAKGVKKFNIILRRFSDELFPSYPCGFAYLVDQDQFQFQKSHLSNYSFYYEANGSAPVVLDWMINNKTCESAQWTDIDDYACRARTKYQVHGCED